MRAKVLFFIVTYANLWGAFVAVVVVAQPPPDATIRKHEHAQNPRLRKNYCTSGIANSSRAAIITFINICVGSQTSIKAPLPDVCLEDCEPIRWSQWERGFKVGLSCNDSNKKLWLIANSTRRELTRIRM